MDERNPQRVPDWLLERLALGELPAAQAEEVRRRLGKEADGAARLEALRVSDRATLAAHPPHVMAAAIHSRAALAGASHAKAAAGQARTGASDAMTAAGPARTGGTGLGVGGSERARSGPWSSFPRRGLAWGVGLAAPVAAAIAVVVVSSGGPPPVAPLETTRMKGLEPRIVLHRKAGADAETLADGATARAHDLLQLAYVAAGRRYGVIVSLDGGGAITRHLPASGPTAASLDQQGATLLPSAYELDDAPGFERFVLVTSDSPFPVEAAVDAARAIVADADADAATRPLALPEGLQQASIVLRKSR